MITSTKNLEKYCKDYKNIENYQEALKSPLRFDLHHSREITEKKSKKQLIDENLYYDRPPEELVFLEHGEHMRLHNANRSEETRQKISEAQKGHEGYWKGKHLSTEARQKISDAMKGKNVGKHLSAAARKKMSNAKKGENNPMFGKNMSAETRQKISDAKKGKNMSAESRQRMSDVKKGRHWHLENGRRVYTD